MCCKGKTTREKGGRDPPDVSLEDIVNDLLKYFDKIDKYHNAKKEAENKYGIIKEHDDCWPADDIKRAWGKTQRMEETSPRRRHWSVVIMTQVIKRQIKRKEQSGLMEAGNLVQRCAEMSVNDTPDQIKARRQNKRREDKKVDISSQSTAVQGTMGAGAVKQHSGGTPQIHSSGQTGGVSQGWTGTPNTVQNQRTGNNRGGFNRQDRPAGTQKIQTQNKNRRETTYIRVPFLEMIPIEPHAGEPVEDVRSDYKLIAGLPETRLNSEIRRRKSYVMSFNHQTGNANWVYEILNRDTLAENPVEAETFGHNYDRGHLAAAANHRWCREARDDANMIDNIVLQHRGLNRGPWKKLENGCRKTASNQNNIRNVHVYSGPIYQSDMNPQVIKDKQVPSHFFKVILEESDRGRVREPQYYLFPNQDLRRRPDQENLDNVEQYRMIYYGTRDQRAITIQDIQRYSGLTFTGVIQNAVAREITGRLRGEDGNTEQCTAEIQVIICN